MIMRECQTTFGKSKLLRRYTSIIAGLTLCLVMGATSVGCGGSNRTTIDGYEVGTFSNKRIFLVLPEADEVAFENIEAFASSRGIASIAAPERFASELATRFPSALDGRCDSNTVLSYRSQPVGLTNPMQPSIDFAGASSNWDWSKISRAGAEGAIDFLVVLGDLTVGSDLPETADGRGTERIAATVHLISIAEGKELDRREILVEIEDPRMPRDSYTHLAKAVAGALPFINSDR